MDLTLEIVEGPRTGTGIRVDRTLVIGRGEDADLTLEDTQASRHHARLTPSGSRVIVEDLESTNGTFVNQSEVHGRAALSPGDELLIGVTVLALRGAAQPSAVRAVPPPLAAAERAPDFVEPVRSKDPGVPPLDRLIDARTKNKARLAPLAIFVLVALVVVIYLGVQ